MASKTPFEDFLINTWKKEMFEMKNLNPRRLVVIEKLSTSVAQRRLDQVRVERARRADMQISREMAVV